MSSPSLLTNGLLQTATTAWQELTDSTANAQESHITIDGQTFKISALVAVARYGASPHLASDADPAVKEKIEAAVNCLHSKLAAGESLYGINTGFGGSADARTSNVNALQLALLQHQQSGLLEVPDSSPFCTPSRPGSSLLLSEEPLSMPEAWVRAAIAVRLNSLMRGHSGVRASVLSTMGALLKHNVIPVVPVRGSISASGDLSPLSYIAGTLAGEQGIEAWVDSPEGTRVKVSADKALAQHGIAPVVFAPKEALGILNGTAFAAGVGGLVMHDGVNLAFLTHLTTAMAVEASTATDASFAPFIHNECRPHPGQIESAATLMDLLTGSKLATHHVDAQAHFLADEGEEASLRQDRYPLRTAPQFMGPAMEELRASYATIEREMNSTTDNPLISVREDSIHHGGNFQAMCVTNAMEHLRLSLAHFGKITFAQATELINPATSRGLSANLAATDPSLNFHCKGVDINLAAACSELQYLASPVSTNIQSAEQNNQAVNSLALISARYSIHAINTLQQLLAWTIYLLCQALDLRALQRRLALHLEKAISASISKHFSTWIDAADQELLAKKVFVRLNRRMDETSARDLEARLMESYMTAGFEILKFFADLPSGGGADPLRNIMKWRNESVAETHAIYRKTALEFLESPRSCHASPYLGKTRRLYEFVRRQLGVGMHGEDNFHEFDKRVHGGNVGGGGFGSNSSSYDSSSGSSSSPISTSPSVSSSGVNAGTDPRDNSFLKRPTIGQNVSVILASIRNGDLYAVMHEVLRDVRRSNEGQRERL